MNKNYIFICNILGSLRATHINGLNLYDDVVRYSRPTKNVIFAEKFFEHVKIGHLYCKDKCNLQYVNMGEWTSKAVLAYADYIVQGVTYIEDPYILNMNVLGTVNNQTFNSDTILRKSAEQTILGSLYIRSRPDQIESLTFQTIYLNSINSYNFAEFYNSLVLKDPYNLELHVSSNLRFVQPLLVNNLNVSIINDRNFSLLANNEIHHLTRNRARKLNRIRDEIIVSLAAQSKFIDHFALVQSLDGTKMLKMVAIESVARNNTIFMGLIVTSQMPTLILYKWIEKSSQLSPINGN